MATLHIVATPIGNLEDLSPRAARVLEQSPVVAAESVARAKKLLAHLGLPGKRLISCREANRRQAAAKVLEALDEGRDVALISDAGTPGLSDPGQAVVQEVAKTGHRVSPVAGPSALAAALSVAGINQAPFIFLGFLPAKTGARKRLLEQAGAGGWTLVAYEAPHRMADTARDLGEVLGERQVVVCRELTKLHEEIVRTTCDQLSQRLDPQRLRGEITLVVGPGPAREADLGEVQRLVDEGLAAGELKPSALAREVAGATGLGREEVYQIILASRQAAGQDGDKAVIQGETSREEPQERQLLVANSLGLHARAAAKITEAVSHLDCQVTLHKGGEEADASSVLSILGLDAPKGSLVTARASGPEADQVLQALDELFTGLFGEGR